ncbi:hypothetical protein ACHAWF_016042 [Thalassiosira exigua]
MAAQPIIVRVASTMLAILLARSRAPLGLASTHAVASAFSTSATTATVGGIADKARARRAPRPAVAQPLAPPRRRGSGPLPSPSSRPSSALAAAATLSFDPATDVRDSATATIVVGRHAALKALVDRTDAYVSLFGFRPHPDVLSSMRASLRGNAASTSHVVVPTVGPAAPRPPHRFGLIGLKDEVTRNNHPLSLHAMTDLVRSSCPGKGTVRVVVCVEDEFPLAPVAAALARAFPLFSKKTGKKKKPSVVEGGEDGDGKEDEDEKLIHVTFLDGGGKVVKADSEIRAAEAAAEGVRLACRLVDTHPEELTTTAYAAECRALFEGDEAVTVEEIVGEELGERGYGGIYNVGKGATEPPRLIILDYDPPKEVVDDEDEGASAITLVGKGIVYDTGGLAIKSRVGWILVCCDIQCGASFSFLHNSSSARTNLRKGRHVWDEGKSLHLLCSNLASSEVSLLTFQSNPTSTTWEGAPVCLVDSWLQFD